MHIEYYGNFLKGLRYFETVGEDLWGNVDFNSLEISKIGAKYESTNSWKNIDTAILNLSELKLKHRHWN